MHLASDLGGRSLAENTLHVVAAGSYGLAVHAVLLRVASSSVARRVVAGCVVLLTEGSNVVLKHVLAVLKRSAAGDNVLILEVEDLLHKTDDRGSVGGEHNGALGHTEDQGGALACANQQVWVGLVDDGDSVRSANLCEREANSGLEVEAWVLLLFVADEYSQHFTVSVAVKGVAESGQLLLELYIVLDDAVVHDRELFAVGSVRVRVAVRRGAVGSPAGVCDAEASLLELWVSLAGVLEVDHLASPLLYAEFPLVSGNASETGRVVTAVLHACKSLQEYVDGGALAEVCNDSAHLAATDG
mmetsp:Transcript_7556/g.13170  ORF Transcript_7556/g.13170 Transcript_7556/m.13170 type:complete len:301 (-) Transcript_7556:251-1153(-)